VLLMRSSLPDDQDLTSTMHRRSTPRAATSWAVFSSGMCIHHVAGKAGLVLPASEFPPWPHSLGVQLAAHRLDRSSGSRNSDSSRDFRAVLQTHKYHGMFCHQEPFTIPIMIETVSAQAGTVVRR